MKRFKMTHKIAAAVTAGVLISESGEASAAVTTGLQALSTNIVNSAGTLPNMISTVAYIGGIGLGVAGIFKLKQHVDNPGQHPMKDGLVRLGAGGGLLALPYMTEVMTSTINAGQAGAAPAVATLQFNQGNFGAGG